MGKSGGAARSPSAKSARAAVMRVSERRSTTKTPKTPEQAHAEKIARAEDAVRKAQARADAANRAVEKFIADPRHQGRGGPLTEDEHARKALRAAQSRLEKLRAANPAQTPAQRAHAAKSAQYEAKIAKARESLAKLEAEYAAHQRSETVTPARPSSRGTASVRPAAPQPSKGVDLRHFSAFAKADPYQLAQGYARGDFRGVLSRMTPTLLKEATDVVMARNPGTKPASRSRKADMIDYIDRYVP